MKALAAAVATASFMMMATSAHADGKCRAALSKGSSALTQAIAKILQKCEQGVHDGKVTGPCPDSKSADSIQKAKDKLTASINKACATSTGEFAFGRCPNETGADAANCGNILIQSKDGVAQCLGCLAQHNATELMHRVVYGSMLPAGSKDIGKCQATIGKATLAFYNTASKVLAGCQASLLKGKVPSCPDAKAATAVQAAEDKKKAAIAKACCGDDEACGGATCDGTAPAPGAVCEADVDCGRCSGGPTPGASCTSNGQCDPGTCAGLTGHCGGSDDFNAITEIGVPTPSCPGITNGGAAIAPHSGVTGNTVIACVDGHADFRAQCQDAAGATFAGGGTFPSFCVDTPTDCAPTGPTHTATVVLTTATDLAGVTVNLGYKGVVFPGTGEVTGSTRITSTHPLPVANDNDDSLTLSVTDLGTPIQSGNVFTVTFSDCGAVPTAAANFGCVVRSASDGLGADIQDGVSCTITVP
jgi:hypothetical protein